MWARSILLASVLAAAALSPPAYAYGPNATQNDDGHHHHRDNNNGNGQGGSHDNNSDNNGRRSFYGGLGFQGRDQGGRGGQDNGDYGRRNIRSLREIADMMRGRFGGDLISARLEDGQRPFYVLRWRMPNGDVRDFEVDAESGLIR